MTSTFVNDLRLNEMGTGDQSGTWGNVTNTNLELIAEALGFGTEAITTNADTHTTTIADGATDPGRAIYIKYTGTLDSACTITIGPNTISRLHIIENATSGSQNIIISQGSGSSVTIGNGAVKAVYLDGAGSGAAVNDALVDLDLTGTTTVESLDLNGGELILDADADTSITADTDDTIDIKIAGSDVYQITATKIDLNGKELVLDADADTSITADTDDQIDIKIGGTDNTFIIGTGVGAGIVPTTAYGKVLQIHDTGTSGANLRLTDSTSSAGTGNGFEIIQIGVNNFLINREAGIMSMYTSGTERMRIDSSGNVGIGTTSISNGKLVVSGSNGTIGGVSGLATFAKGSTGGGAIEAGDNTAAIQVGSDGTNGFISTGSNDMRFLTAAGERMRIDSSGNVGVGTNSPPSFGSGFTSFQANGTSSGIVQANNSTNSVTTEIEAEGTRGAVGTRTNHDFVIKTNQTEAMRIDSSGRVLIGTTSEYSGTGAELIVDSSVDIGNGSSSDNAILAFAKSATTGTIGSLQSKVAGFSTMPKINFTATNVGGGSQAGDIEFYTTTSATQALRMTIDGSGNVGINRTAASSIKLDVETSGSNHPARFKSDNVSFGTIFDNIAGSGNRFFCDFRINNSTKGKIFSDGSTTTYSQSSDYRLKENVVTDWDATTRLKQLKPSRFNFKENKDITYDGFLAHEVSSIVPQAVDGEKDAVDENGNPQYQGIDHSKLVPLLTKALQELEARLTALEAK